MGEVMDAADYRIDNTGSLAEFRSRVRELLNIDDTEANDLQH